MENWKDIKGYEGLYQISDKGVVKGVDRVLAYNAQKTKQWKGKVIKTIVDYLGYCRVSLCKDGKVKCHKIHRLVAEAFLNGEGQINHKDGNKLNNNLNNLEFCTVKENLAHAYTTGLRPKNICAQLFVMKHKNYSLAKWMLLVKFTCHLLWFLHI